MTRTIYALVGVALVSLITPPSAIAVDGQVAITQAKAMAGGVTPGDSPGFPVSITQPGSYVLSGNLTVPNASTNAIVISSDHVTLDLNGFAILGPTDCSGGLNPCAGEGPGVGISTDSDRFNITIRNGTVQGMGNYGIALTGDSHRVEYIHARSNGRGGIAILGSQDRGSSIVQHSSVQRNGGVESAAPPFGPPAALWVTRGLVSHNVVSTNFTGIKMDAGTVSGNFISRNVVYGLDADSRVSYFDNTFDANGNHLSIAFRPTNMGRNLCGNNPCP